uniref:C-C motif chemokine n=1 Tax=Scleropages formosus TaxID=113540 RepID=A0A8C9R0X1_SCLFO
WRGSTARCAVLMDVLIQSTFNFCTGANEPAECCFDYFERDINKKFITSYSQTRPDCPKKGIIFYTRRSKEICVSPEQEWVQKVIKYLDKHISAT